MLYSVKRCIALPGDTVEIRDTRYRVRGYDKELGNIVSQNSLAHFLEKPVSYTHLDVYKRQPIMADNLL